MNDVFQILTWNLPFTSLSTGMTLSTFTDLNAFCKSDNVFNSLKNYTVCNYNLQHFEVVDVLVLQLGVELDLLEHHGAGKQHVHELAVDGPGAELLDLDVSGGEAVVDPGQHVVPGEVVSAGAGSVDVDCHPGVVLII